MKFKYLLIIIVMPIAIWHSLCVARSDIASGQAQLQGYVLDASTEEPISGATLVLTGAKGGAFSDSSGYFVMDHLSSGKYSLKISHISYKSKVIENIKISSKHKFTSLNIKLSRKIISIKGITVTPSRYSIVGAEPSTRQSLTSQQLSTVPQVGDDFMRALSRLPGVGSNDFSTRITVRGGEYDEILVMLDGMQIYEPFHLKDVDGGAMSIIDVAAIDGIDIMTGGFPANYGDKMSGVFNIKSRQPRPGQNKLSVGLSLLNLKALGEGTFDKNNGSWLLSLRRGYVDYVLRLTGDDDELDPTYYDAYGKLQYQLGKSNYVSVNFLHAGDRLKYLGEDNYEGNTLRTKYGNSYGWLTFKSIPASNLTMNMIISTGRVNHNRIEIYNNPSSDLLTSSTQDKKDFRFAGLKADVEFEDSENLLMKFGLEYKRMWCDYDYLHQVYYYYQHIYPGGSYYQLNSIDSIYIPLIKSGYRFAAYLTNRIRITPNFFTEFGLRHDFVSYSNDELTSPRLNAVYNFGERTSLRIGWGYFYQSEALDEIFIGDGETDFSAAEKAEHWVVGLQHVIANGINLRLEGYVKKYSDLRPDPRNSFYDIEPFPEYDPYRAIYFRESSISKGIELYLKKETSGKFSWWFSYALAWVEDSLNYVYLPSKDRLENQNQDLPSPTDQRHTIYLDISYRPSLAWQFNFAWQFHSGWPYTDYNIATSGLDSYWEYAGQLTARHSPYNRFDLRINRNYLIGKGRLTVFAELINALNNKNIRSYDYNRNRIDGVYEVEKKPQYWLGILPSIGISYQVNY